MISNFSAWECTVVFHCSQWVFLSVLYREFVISNFSEIGVYCTLSFLSMGVFIYKECSFSEWECTVVFHCFRWVFLSVLYREFVISNFSVIGVYCTLSFLSMGVFIYKESAVSVNGSVL